LTAKPEWIVFPFVLMAVDPVMLASLFDLAAPRRLARSAAMFAMGFSISQSDTEILGSKIDQIKDRGELVCGIDDGRPGFTAYDKVTGWTGFEVDFCRAYAAAFLGDPDSVRLVPLSSAERFAALRLGQVDILLSTTSWTFSRSVSHPVQFAGVYYYDGQGFLVASDLGVSSAVELDGARVCVQSETTTFENLQNFTQSYSISIEEIEVKGFEEGFSAYQNGECDAFTSDVSALAAARQLMDDPYRHTVLADIISKEPLSPVVEGADRHFAEAVRWVGYALITAEEYAITATNAVEQAQSSPVREVRRLLGSEGPIGGAWGLDAEFALRAIQAGGNYGEIFHRNLGDGSSIGLSRGLNAQWSQGGLIYAPPIG
jgi:general L-amino acid transport system substrate-binding protein